MAKDRVIVGKVSVKVAPDTSGFDNELRRELKQHEAGIRPVHVDVEVGDVDIVSDVNRTIERAQRQIGKIRVEVDVDRSSTWKAAIKRIEREIDKLDNRTLDLDVELDRDSLNAARDLLDEEFRRPREIRLRYDHDRAGLEKVRQEIEQRLRGIERRELTIYTDADSLRSHLAWVNQELDQLNNRVKIDVDMSDPMEIRAGIARINAELKKLDNAEIDVHLDEASLSAVKRELERELLRPHQVKVEYHNDEQGIRDLRDEIDRRLREFNKVEIEIGTDEASLRATRHKLDEIIDDYDEKKLQFEPVTDASNNALVSARLAILARDRWVVFRPFIDSKAAQAVQQTLAGLSGLRLLDSTFRNLWDLFKNMDKNIPLIGSITLAVMGLAGWLMTASTNLFAVSRSLAQIGAIALTLPGILGGFAVGIGVSVAALKDFNNVLPDVRDKLGDLQDAISINFWRQAKAPFRDLIDNVFPEFALGAKVTANAVGSWFGELASSLSRHLGGAMEPMFHSLNQSIFIASGGLDAAASAMEILGRRGSEYLPRFATWFRNVTKNFESWLRAADESGKLTGWIELAITNLNALGRVLRYTGSILSGVARAAEEAGGSSLVMMADTLERVAAVVNGDVFQRKFVQVFQAAHEAMTAIATRSGPEFKALMMGLSDVMTEAFALVGVALGDLLDGIFTALNTDGFKSGFLEFLDGIRLGIASLEPAWEHIGNALGNLGRVAGTLAENFGPLLGAALIFVADALERLEPIIDSVSDSLSGRLLRIIDALAEPVAFIAEGLAGLLGILIQVPGLVEVAVIAFAGLKTAMAVQAVATYVGAVQSAIIAIGELPAKATAAKAAVGGLDTKFRTFGKGAAIVAIIAAVVAGLTALGDLGDEAAIGSVNDYQFAIHELAGSLNNLGDGMQSVATDRALESLFWLDDQSGWTAAIGRFVIGNDDAAISVYGMADAIRHATDDSLMSDVQGFFDTIGGFASPVNLSKDAIAQFDSAITDMVAAGQITEAQVALDYFAEQATVAGVSAEDAALLIPLATEAMKGVELGAELAAVEVQTAADALDIYNAAIESVGGVTPGMIQSVREGSMAFVDFQAHINDAEMTAQDWMESLREQVRQQASWADNMAILMRKGVSEGVIKELARLGPEGAMRVAELTELSDTELGELNDIFDAKANGVNDLMTEVFGDMASEVNAAVASIPEEALSALGGLPDDMHRNGLDATNGFINGLLANGATSRAYGAGGELGRAASRGMQNALDIRSPSRVMRQLGVYTAEGFVEGIESMVTAVEEVAKRTADAAREGMSGDIAVDLKQRAREARELVAVGGGSPTHEFNYYASDNSGFSDEEEFWEALGRGRGFGGGGW